jgi:hypothetical protein
MFQNGDPARRSRLWTSKNLRKGDWILEMVGNPLEEACIMRPRRFDVGGPKIELSFETDVVQKSLSA